MEKINRFRIPINIMRRFMCTPAKETTSAPASRSTDSMSSRYKPSEFQKFVLVWTKKYKTKDEIPNLVSAELIDRARSEARIKLSNILILATILGCVFAVVSGKAAAKRGESVHQMNLDWHKQYKDEKKKEESSVK